MPNIYTDYVNKTAISIPDTFIDVKTGESHPVSPKIQQQIEYHSQNNTLIHLVLSALTSYLQPRRTNGGTEEILVELSEIKQMMQQVTLLKSDPSLFISQKEQTKTSVDLDLKELEEVLDAFGG